MPRIVPSGLATVSRAGGSHDHGKQPISPSRAGGIRNGGSYLPGGVVSGTEGAGGACSSHATDSPGRSSAPPASRQDDCPGRQLQQQLPYIHDLPAQPKKLCLGVWGDVEKAAAIAGLIGLLIQVWQLIKNKQKGEQSDKGEGTEGGSDKGKDLCLAAAATTSDGHDRVYVTSNCSDNKYASWRCVEVARNACNYYNVASLDQGDSYELTILNTRNHADVYVKPATSGDWQKWLWTYWDTCKKNCLHTSRAKVTAGQASIPG
jgi:hypothetical protein